MSFTIVRFGNVIGSSGSVIPLFFNQIAEKKALTVTSKKVKKIFHVYFRGSSINN